MTFFNKKEDVMKIELTPYGRHLLMKGQLKPHYYAFFDDDILYDSQAAGFSEDNTQTKTRILTNTPSLKPPTTLTSVESRYFNQITKEDDNVLLNPIGTNQLTSNKANGWEVTAILGEFSSSLNYMSSSTGTSPIMGTISPLYNIPQIECELNFTMSIGRLGIDKYDSIDYYSSEIAEDQTFVKLSRQPLILHLLEKNGFSYKDSMSLEIFEYDPDEQSFNKLNFLEEIINEDDMDAALLESDYLRYGDREIDPDSVENYFFIKRDRQILNLDLCRGIKKLKEKNIYLGLDINCQNIDDDQEINIYQTLVEEDDIEDCEA